MQVNMKRSSIPIKENQAPDNLIKNEAKIRIDSKPALPKGGDKIKNYLEQIETLKNEKIINEKNKRKMESSIQRLQEELASERSFKETLEIRLSEYERKREELIEYQKQIQSLNNDLNMSIKQNELLSCELQNKRRQLEELQNSTQSNVFQVDHLSRENSALVDKNDTLKAKVDQLQEQLTAVRVQNESISQRNQELEEEQEVLLLKNTQKNQEYEELSNKCNKLNLEFAQMSQEFLEKKKNQNELSTQYSLLEKNNEIIGKSLEKLQGECREIRSNLKEEISKNHELSATMSEYELRIKKTTDLLSQKDILIRDTQEENRKVNEEFVKIKKNRDELLDLFNENRSKAEEMESELLVTKKHNLQLQTSINDLQKENASLQSKNNSMGSRILYLEKSEKNLKLEIEKLSSEAHELSLDNQVLMAQLEEQTAEIGSLEKSVNQKCIVEEALNQRELDLQEKNSMSNALSSRLAEAEDIISQLKKQLIIFQEKLSKSESEYSRINSQLQQKDHEMEKIQKQSKSSIEDLRKKLQDSNQKLVMIQDEIENDESSRIEKKELIQKNLELQEAISILKKEKKPSNDEQIQIHKEEIRRLKSIITKLESQKEREYIQSDLAYNGDIVAIHTLKMTINDLQKSNDSLRFELKTLSNSHCSNQEYINALSKQLEEEKFHRKEIMKNLQSLKEKN